MAHTATTHDEGLAHSAIRPSRSSRQPTWPPADNLTAPETAEMLRCPTETLRYWRARGEGPRWFKIGRRVLYAREDVEAFIAEAKAAGGGDAA